MTKEEILGHLRVVLQEGFGTSPDSVMPDTRLYEDLDIDSIDAVDLLVRLRSLTDRRLKPEEFRSVRTIGDVVDVLHQHFSEKA